MDKSIVVNDGALKLAVLWTVSFLVLMDSVAGADTNCSCLRSSNSSITCNITNMMVDDDNIHLSIDISNGWDTTLNCTCHLKDTSSCPSKISSKIAAAVLVPMLLEALIVAGVVVAAVLLRKWRSRIPSLLTQWPTLKTYVEHTLHNPTYGAEDYPTSPMPPSESAGPVDLYEEISGEQDDKTEDPIPSCYAYAVHEFPQSSEDSDQKDKPQVFKTDTLDPQASQPPQNNSTTPSGNKAVLAYAVSGIAAAHKQLNSRSFSSNDDTEDRNATASASHEHASRHFSDGNFSKTPQFKKKKPKPMPKKVRGLGGLKSKPTTAAGAVNVKPCQAGSSGSGVTIRDNEKYSKLNQKTQYMGLEPHMGPSNGKKTKVLPDATHKEDYSHLNH